ncbi:hypothetical protein UlMin_005146 [Ulmus minor]
MGSAMKAAFVNSKAYSFNTRVALFHSTPVLDRRRRNYWDSRQSYNHYNKRFQKLNAKRTLLRNINAYADYLLQRMQNNYEHDDDDPSSSSNTSWFRKQYSTKDFGRNRSGNGGSRPWRRKGFRITDDEDDIDVETVFRNAFGGGSRSYYWSFINEENPQWRGSSSYSGKYWNFRRKIEEEYESEYESSDPNLASHRLALGLSTSGPLNLEDVKKAYRSCALKWHPDRHQGSSKAIAEEKFKLCSAAYQSICDRLAVE